MRHPKRAISRDVRTRAPKRRGQTVTEFEALGWPESALRVKNLMSRATLTVGPETPVGRAWKQMQARRVRHLPVVEEGGRLVGIVSDRDLRQVILEPAIQEQLGNMSRALNILTVRHIMTWGVVSVRPDTDIRRAAQMLREQRISALPVVEGDRLVGMLTATDIIRGFVALLEEGVLSKPERWGKEG
jgi:acetoin utilization protein AcuB